MSNNTLDKVALLSLNGNKPLAKRISDYMGIPLLDATVSHFSDGEINIQMNESIRGKDVYIIHSVSDPVNDNFMELMIAVDALRRASARNITCVLPYFAYTRSDRKSRSREPISAKLFANMLEMGQVDRVIALDMHADQIQGFFDIPVDHLRAMPIFASYFEKKIKNPDDFVFVAPDHNSTKRARALAEVFGSQIAIVDQRSTEVDDVIPDIIGDVDGKQCVIVDDLIDTGTRMLNSAKAIKNAGAKTISAAATHAIFSHDAAKKLCESPLFMEVLISDSIVVPDEDKFAKLKILSVTELMGDAIRMTESNESIDSLFQVRDNYTEIK